MADLKADAMRPDLERLGYWDREWARERFLSAYVPVNTHVIVVDEQAVGCIGVRPEPDACWLEHFYLRSQVQGRGLGGQVLRHVLAAHPGRRPFKLALDRGSQVRRLYERHGFTHQYDEDNGVDQVFQLRGDR